MSLKLMDEKSLLLKKGEIDKTKEECVENFNKNNCVTPKTKLIIVGTITPKKGMENGYFYTAPRNKIYGYIDGTIKTNLKELKKSLQQTTSYEEKQKIITQIKNTLKENNIAFLDIMKFAIRKLGSPYDNDIKNYCLDIESFRNIPNSVYFICNSRLAEQGYLEICKNLGREINYSFLSQRMAKKVEWIETIKKHST